jgi:calcineurin-like phosphoesterase family protein
MKTFFTSDSHFDDDFAIEYFHRPFRNVDEMNAVMAERWNEVVSKDDVVYHLGDFTLEDLHHFAKWAGQLNGHIKILPGSHDQPWLKDFVASERIQVLAPLVSVRFSEVGVAGRSQIIVLCHYSMQVWYGSNQGSWHLFGHSHGKLRGVGLSFDVGVDCTGFMPLSLDQVAEKMAHLV